MSWLDDLNLGSIGEWLGTEQGGKATETLFNLGLGYAAEQFGLNDPQIQKTGYLGEIPRYDAVRERVPGTYDPLRRPGSSGQRYFTDTQFLPRGSQPAGLGAAGLSALNLSNLARQTRPVAPVTTPVPVTTNLVSPAPLARGGIVGFQNKGAVTKKDVERGRQAPWYKRPLMQGNRPFNELSDILEGGINSEEKANRVRYLAGELKRGGRGLQIAAFLDWTVPSALREWESKQGGLGFRAAGVSEPTTLQSAPYLTGEEDRFPIATYAREAERDAASRRPGADIGEVKRAKGGIVGLRQGKYVNGATSGMADAVPANIEGTQEARLSDGEFVVPADVVSHLGNGNSDAGADELYDMMDRIRKARTGTTKQAKEIDPREFLPA